ncbi:MAG: hypothetical protein Q7U75_15705, partial [Desulfobacterales bacterium]|nr:hypothetical protein [Desulfobacterales bacterium]
MLQSDRGRCARAVSRAAVCLGLLILASWCPPASAQELTATLTTPAAGATGVSVTPTFQWTSVPGAQAYVLWVGTTAGARDVLGTSETAQTSYTAVTALPEATALHAR